MDLESTLQPAQPVEHLPGPLHLHYGAQLPVDLLSHGLLGGSNLLPSLPKQ